MSNGLVQTLAGMLYCPIMHLWSCIQNTEIGCFRKSLVHSHSVPEQSLRGGISKLPGVISSLQQKKESWKVN